MWLQSIFTKRWFIHFLMFYIPIYLVAFLMFTVYEITLYPLAIMASILFSPIWSLYISHRYFRGSTNDWTDRLVTAVGWTGLLLVVSAMLVMPVYGYSWTSILNLNGLNSQWLNVAGILVGGIVAGKGKE